MRVQCWRSELPRNDFSDGSNFPLDEPEYLPIGKKDMPMKTEGEVPRLVEQFLRLSALATGFPQPELELLEHA